MSSDPLKLAPTHVGPLFTTVEIPTTYVAALAELRLKAGIKDTLTARFLGSLVVQALLKVAGELGALPGLLGETPIYYRLRNALGVLTAEGKVWLARSDLSGRTGISQPMVTLFVRWGVSAGILEEGFGSSLGGRPSKVVKLTTLGLKHGEKDHPDESVRFALGGMLPEAVIEKEIQKYEQDPLKPEPCAVCGLNCVVCVTCGEHGHNHSHEDWTQAGRLGASVGLVEAGPEVKAATQDFWKKALERVAKGSDPQED